MIANDTPHLDAGRYGMADYSDLLPQPLDPEFNRAVLQITANLFPNGFDVIPADQAPDTWDDLHQYVQDTGRMAVTDHGDEEDVFRDAYCYHAFRAWHDWTHLFMGARFGGIDRLGEAVAARAQEAQLAALYGPEKAARWAGYVHKEVLTSNFGEDAPDESVMVLSDRTLRAA